METEEGDGASGPTNGQLGDDWENAGGETNAKSPEMARRTLSVRATNRPPNRCRTRCDATEAPLSGSAGCVPWEKPERRVEREGDEVLNDR